MAGDGKYDLEQIQRWMQAVIVHPLGVEQGIASSDARRHVDVDPVDLEQVVTRSKALSAVERLAIYGYAYYARLLECLKEEFPAVLLGRRRRGVRFVRLGLFAKISLPQLHALRAGGKIPAISSRNPADGRRAD